MRPRFIQEIFFKGYEGLFSSLRSLSTNSEEEGFERRPRVTWDHHTENQTRRERTLSRVACQGLFEVTSRFALQPIHGQCERVLADRKTGDLYPFNCNHPYPPMTNNQRTKKNG